MHGAWHKESLQFSVEGGRGSVWAWVVLLFMVTVATRIAVMGLE